MLQARGYTQTDHVSWSQEVAAGMISWHGFTVNDQMIYGSRSGQCSRKSCDSLHLMDVDVLIREVDCIAAKVVEDPDTAWRQVR